jgi:hypothetical protein
MSKDGATKILRAWVNVWNDKPDDPRAESAVKSLALRAGVDDEFDAAIAYALEQGWLAKKKTGWLTLTAAGWSTRGGRK